MTLSLTLGTLVTRCQQRANAVGSSQIETPEWKSIITEVYGELHSAVAEVGARYFETESTISVSTFALPSDHLSTIGVDFVDSASRRRPLAELMVQELSMFGGLTGEAYAFAIGPSTIQLYPTPSTGTYKHLYVPQPTDYSSSSDATVVDVINAHGLAFVIWGVSAIALHRAESAQQSAMLARDKAFEKLIGLAVARALTMPKRRVITDAGQLTVDAWDPSAWRYLP